MSISTHGMLASAMSYLGEDTKALDAVAQMRRLDPTSPVINTYVAWIEGAFGDRGESIRAGEILAERYPFSSLVTAVRAFALAQAGEKAAAKALLLTLSNTGRYPAPDCAMAAFVWQSLGNPDAAIRSLAAAAEARDYWLGMTLHHPLLAPLRAQHVFQVVYNSVMRSLAR
jgi:predicted Zn-dependent protease